MAISVRESREGRLAELLRLVMPFPGRLEFAVRLALICAITTLVVEIYQTPEPALTVYLVFFLNKPDRGTSLILSLAMLALFSLIVSSVILVAMIVIDQPVWRVASMAAISLGLLFLASASKLRPIGGTVALIVAFALDQLGTSSWRRNCNASASLCMAFRRDSGRGVDCRQPLACAVPASPRRTGACPAFAPRHRHAGYPRRRRNKARLHRMFARGKWRIAKVAEGCLRREKRGSRSH